MHLGGGVNGGIDAAELPEGESLQVKSKEVNGKTEVWERPRSPSRTGKERAVYVELKYQVFLMIHWTRVRVLLGFPCREEGVPPSLPS